MFRPLTFLHTAAVTSSTAAVLLNEPNNRATIRHNARKLPPKQTPLPIAMPNPWDRRPDEPTRWYARFGTFRLLGPTRTLEDAYRAAAQLESLPGKRPGSGWRSAAARYDWQARAAAYDDAQRADLEANLQNHRSKGRSTRINMVEQLLTIVFNVILHANLSELDQDEARAFLPTLRVLFMSMLTAHRTEIGAPTDAAAAGLEPFTVDDFLAATAALNQTQDAARLIQLRDTLADLYPDEPSARRLAAQAGLTLSRISFSSLAVNNWHAVLTEAHHASSLQSLLAIVTREYPHNVALKSATEHYKGSNHARQPQPTL